MCLAQTLHKPRTRKKKKQLNCGFDFISRKFDHTCLIIFIQDGLRELHFLQEVFDRRHCNCQGLIVLKEKREERQEESQSQRISCQKKAAGNRIRDLATGRISKQSDFEKQEMGINIGSGGVKTHMHTKMQINISGDTQTPSSHYLTQLSFR